VSCCGKRRAAVRRVEVRPAAVPEAATEPDRSDGVVIEYQGDAAVVYRGPSTGSLYTFSAGRRVRRLERRDAERLLRSPLFRRGAE